MTDHNREDREALIEKAADAMFTANDGQLGQGYDEMARAALAVFEQAHTSTSDEREALVGHCWYTTRWGDGMGGFNWKCSCGVNDRGTGAENPERFVRYETERRAALAAVEHIAAGFRRTAQGEPTAHRFEGESDPIATNPILRGVDLALERLVRRDCFTERTLRILDELRAEVLGVETPAEVRAHYAPDFMHDQSKPWGLAALKPTTGSLSGGPEPLEGT